MGILFPLPVIRAMAAIKRHMAAVHGDLGLLSPEVSRAVMTAAREVEEGRWDGDFPVEVFQTGSGTGSHMNVNEVLAGRANEILTGARGGKRPVHPNDHVNMGQSTNDVVPSALHAATLIFWEKELFPALARLLSALSGKAAEFSGVLRVGRTHFMDAVPMRLGDAFKGYARQVSLGMERLASARARLLELPLGGTAVGNGLNTHPGAAARVISLLASETGIPFTPAANRFEAQGARDAAVEASGALKTVAASLWKMAQDLRFLSSGPDCGIGEIRVPALLPGSSFMPGKVNPVICEVLVQAAAQVIGNDAAITTAALSGGLELCAAIPVIARNLLESSLLLARAAQAFSEKCVEGLSADMARTAGNVEKSLATVTLLAPIIGYDRAAVLAKEAHASGRTVKSLALSRGLVTEEDWNAMLAKI